jgi:DNA-binding CsgD family transcriptional regulator
VHRAQVGLLRAQIAYASGPHTAARSLLDAARRLEPLDIELARDTYRDAIGSAVIAGGVDVPDVARAVLAAAKPTPPRPADLLLDSLAVAHLDGFAAAMPLVDKALRDFCSGSRAEPSDPAWLWLAALTATHVWDDEGFAVLSARHARAAREVGDLSALPLPLNSLAYVHLFAGERAAATSVVAELQAVAEATGVAMAPYGALALAAWRGDGATTIRQIEASLAEVASRGEDAGTMIINWVQSLLLNALARYREALPAARVAADHPVASAVANWALLEVIESAVRSGRPEIAADAYERLAESVRPSETNWGLGVLARSGALLATGEAADALYRQAIDRLGRTRIRMELARAHLLYGEWLRRENRRSDARGQLRVAHDMFTAADAGAFAERARRELAATGESVAERAAAASDTLTAQEAHIAGLAGSGLTNTEIGAQMFLSPHTVEWHLRKVFTKLGITSRRQLRPPETGPGRP